MAKVVTIVLENDETFSVRSDGNSIKFNQKGLLKALEEAVFQIRGRRPRLGVVEMDVDKKNAPKASTTTQESPQKNLEPHEERYNGGLGRVIQDRQNINGFGGDT
jgi:hypothetical protein